MEVIEENLKFVPLIDRIHGTEGECICLDENANQEPGVDETIEFSSILMNESIDLCPKPKPVRSFYFVKCELYESPQLQSQINQAQKEMQQSSQAWLQFIKASKTKEVRSLHCRMQHGKRTLVEVKQLHKEIKQLEETREKVRANDIEMNRDFCQQRDEIYQTFKFGLVERFQYQVMVCLTKLFGIL
ncbi:hypothetical protein MKX03_022837 [Papaver bracteatum]|nr:hypothetical protein MKX03_022837 [Papaver bracteatum]